MNPMLLNHFYSLLYSENTHDNEWVIKLRLNPDHAIYQGHFPDQPVVPGVCLLQLIKENAEQIKKQSLQYTQINSCKFLSAINPSETSDLELKLILKEDIENCSFSLIAEGNTPHGCFIKVKAVLSSHR